MAHSCIERSVIRKVTGDRPREQGNRYRKETGGASDAQGADNADYQTMEWLRDMATDASIWNTA